MKPAAVFIGVFCALGLVPLPNDDDPEMIPCEDICEGIFDYCVWAAHEQ